MRGGTSLVVQWLRFHAFTAGDMGSTPGQGAEHGSCLIPVSKKKKKYGEKRREEHFHARHISQVISFSTWDRGIAEMCQVQPPPHLPVHPEELEQGSGGDSSSSSSECNVTPVKPPTQRQIGMTRCP